MAMPRAIAELFGRVGRGLRRFDVGGSVRRLASLGRDTLARSLYLRERHLWYVLRLDAPVSRNTCPPGFDLTRAVGDDVALLETLPTIGVPEARRRCAAGADLWLMREGACAAFACWIFRHRTPMLAARNGWLTLPPFTVCLEDSVTSPAYQGRGLASAACLGIARDLQDEHLGAIITKVAEDNSASRRAVEKAGFELVATMTLTRRLRRSQVELQPYQVNPITTFLVTALAR
jgi:L-amino acid N-acyltransferase YncA